MQQSACITWLCLGGCVNWISHLRDAADVYRLLMVVFEKFELTMLAH